MKAKAENIFILSLIGFTAGFILLLFLAQWPQWWKWIIFERTPMTWLESMLLVLTGFTGLLNALTAHWEKEKKSFWLWLLLGAGFIALALDERFAIHERIRDSILAPKNIKLPWTSPGDVVLLVAMIAGLVLLPKFLKLFQKFPSAKKIFLTGVGLAVLAIGMDSFDVHSLSINAQRWLQFIEELLETGAQLCFFSGVFLIFSKKLKERIHPEKKA